MGRYINMHIKEVRYECVDWIQLVQVRDWWWAVVNMLINL
jgi:hypothetical protein